MSDIAVTDHAVQRYVERVMGLDLEAVRAEIRSKVAGAVAIGATSATVEGVTYVLKGKTVVTLGEGRSPSSFRHKGWKHNGSSLRVKR